MNQVLMQKDKLKVQLIKQIMTEKKTILLSLRTKTGKKIHGRNWKDKKIVNKYPKTQYHSAKCKIYVGVK